MTSGYSEQAPVFAQSFNGMVVVVDGLLTLDLPWERDVSTARFAKRLSGAGIGVSLIALGSKTPLDLVATVAAEDVSTADRALTVLDEFELEWAFGAKVSPVAGLRELVQHLAASGIPVVFATALGDRVAQGFVSSTVARTTPATTIGRRSTGDLAQTYAAIVHQGRSAIGEHGAIGVLVGAKVARLIPPSELGASVLVVGDGDVSSEATGLDVIDLASQCALTSAEREDIDKRLARRDRVRELRTTGTMTHNEMAEYLDLTGGARVIGNVASFGYVDDKKGLQNAQLLRSRRSAAAKEQFLLEVISADAALLEVALRNWMITHHKAIFQANERITFGQTVDRVESFGFATSLVERLRAFNRLRNDAVHHLARGIDTYYDLTKRYMDDCALLDDAEQYVLEAAPMIGRPAETY